AVEGVVAMVRGKETSGVDLDAARRYFLLLLLRQGVPQCANEWLLVSALEQDADHGELSGGVGVDEVHAHLVAPAMDLLLARAMEVELRQSELPVSDGERAAGAVADHDGGAVVASAGAAVA